MTRTYWVYILCNRSGQVYVGVTGDLSRRIAEHQSGCVEGHSRTYNLRYLVYCQDFADVNDALTCEKKLKGWSRAKKIALIESVNPEWKDLANNLDGFDKSQIRSRQSLEPDMNLLQKLRKAQTPGDQ